MTETEADQLRSWWAGAQVALDRSLSDLDDDTKAKLTRWIRLGNDGLEGLLKALM